MTRRAALALLSVTAFSRAGAAPVPGSCRQLLRVESADWSATRGTLTLWTRGRADAPWQQDGKAIPVMLGRSGLRWGRGLHTGANLPAYPGTRGTTNAAWASYLVRGTGALDVRIGSCRAGFVTTRIAV